MKSTWLCAVLCIVATVLSAQSVDRAELESQITGSVDFQNYEGAYDAIESAEAIRGIGVSLGQLSLTPENSRSYAGRYRVIHAVDPESRDGLDADIFILLPDAQVDHIDNVRRIIGAYLETAYAYRRTDAATLAEFITIYNALYRGNVEFFQARYKQVVMDNVTPDGVGISTLYSDWPGNTEMVIPLSPGAAPGEIGALDPLSLADDEVIDQLRMREDMGIAQRKALVDIMEQVIEEERQEIEEERAAIEEERDQLAQQEEELTEEEPEDAVTAAEDEPQQTQEEIEERREELDQQEQELDQQEERVQEIEEEVREQREEIAADQREQLGQEEESVEERAAAPAPVAFLRVRESGDEQLRQFVLVEPDSGEVLQESEFDAITSSRALSFQEERLVIARLDGAARLLLIDGTNLELLRRGEETVFGRGVLQHGPNEELIYAIVRQEGDWYLGRFDRELELQERSSVAVNRYTSLSFQGGSIYVQLPSGRITSLSVDDMSQNR